MRPDELLHQLEQGCITDAEFVVLVCAEKGLQQNLTWLAGHPELLDSVQAAVASVAAGAYGSVAGMTVVGRVVDDSAPEDSAAEGDQP